MQARLLLVHSPLVGGETWAPLAGCPAAFRHRVSRLPMAMFEEIYPPAPGWPDVPGGYLQLSEAHQDEAARARELGDGRRRCDG